MYALGRHHRGYFIELGEKSRRIHLALVGGSGTGKSTLLANLMLDDIHSGRGFALIDPHGDLAEYIADHIPPERVNDVVYFDPSDPTHAVGFNPLSSDLDSAVLTDDIVSGFEHIWRDSWGPRMEYILMNAIRLLLDTPNSTLLQLPLLLVDDRYRQSLLKRCSDPVIRMFWETEFTGYSDKFRVEAIAPIQNKIGQFTSNPTIRAIIGQANTLDIPGIINGRKILIANLSKRMGSESSHLIGAQLTTAIAHAAQARATIPEESRQDFTLYVDEFQNFATDAFAEILSEMRKWRLNLVLANQFMGQVPHLLRESILGNVGTLVVFRVGAADAPMLAQQLRFNNPNELSSTPNYTAWAKTMIGDGPTEPLQVRMFPLQSSSGGSLQAVRSRTHSRYARKRVDVEREVADLFRRPQPKPKAGGTRNSPTRRP